MSIPSNDHFIGSLPKKQKIKKNFLKKQASNRDERSFTGTQIHKDHKESKKIDIGQERDSFLANISFNGHLNAIAFGSGEGGRWG